MIKGIIFDLDNTLFDTTEMAIKARSKAVDHMIMQGLNATKKEAFSDLLKIVECRGSNYEKHFDDLCMVYNKKIDPKIIAAGIAAYHDEVLRIFHETTEPKLFLKKIKNKKKSIKLVLVTLGIPSKQWEKIHRLGLTDLFDLILVGEDIPEMKIKLFRKAMSVLNLKPCQVLCVGDRLDIEIHQGNELGLVTARILRGKYKYTHPSYTHEIPDLHITNLNEILSILDKADKISSIKRKFYPFPQ